MKNTTPRWSIPLHSTVRDDGRPVVSAVANTIAFGSGRPAPRAASNQSCNCACQVAASWDSSSAPCS